MTLTFNLRFSGLLLPALGFDRSLQLIIPLLIEDEAALGTDEVGAWGWPSGSGVCCLLL